MVLGTSEGNYCTKDKLKMTVHTRHQITTKLEFGDNSRTILGWPTKMG